MHPEPEVRRLYDGLRSALSHEYGTRNVALTNRNPKEHWNMPDGKIRVLNLELLIEAFEEGFERFYIAVENDAALRAKVLPHSKGLIVLGTLPGIGTAASYSASATSISFSAQPRR